MRLIVDAHQDLAWNMLTFGRDYRLSAAQTRLREAAGPTPARNGNTLLGWEDYQRGQVAILFSTLFASPLARRYGEWETECYRTPEEAHHRYAAQLETYTRLTEEAPQAFRLLDTRAALQAHLEEWRRPLPPEKSGHPVGLVLLMEGGEGIRSTQELPWWWEHGLRILGPAWAGTRFCGGTRDPGPLTREGEKLLDAMAELNLALDLSHMDALAALQALDRYPGPVLASHSNPQALMPGTTSNRHLPDVVIDRLLEHQAVIGIVFYNTFLLQGWQKGDPRSQVPLERVVEHLDYICQRAGDALHAGIGTDFDGGLGLEDVPEGLETIADLQKLAGLLAARGYQEADIDNLLGQNWIRFLERTLP